MHTVHLVSNAHIDPVWQWEWEEGVAVAISTFRVAADLCEQFDGFIFNHNESLLYRWVEEYEPALFQRIQALVAAGRWHIMGGWYVQPDCNMPSGESFIRQIRNGLRYFQDRFGVRPTTAINFDPFGHSRGLVQILARCGYDSYLFCRPSRHDITLPAEDFLWVGFDGSVVKAHRAQEGYNSALGKVNDKIDAWLQLYAENDRGICLWGVGDHGGGPSRADLEALTRRIAESKNISFEHSTPERYFAQIDAAALPRHADQINPWAVGCYTSQVRVKQMHRRLENWLYSTEKALSAAVMNGLMAWPAGELDEAERDLLMAEFHDILPGSSIQPAEDMALRLMDHGLELLSRLRARAFYALCAGQPVASEGVIPIVVLNPHPWPVDTIVECEMQMADQNWADTWHVPSVWQNGVPVPAQLEKELGNLPLDWRKRVAFHAHLEPMQVTRFDCRLTELPARPDTVRGLTEPLRLNAGSTQVVIGHDTGLIDEISVDGVRCVTAGAFKALVIADNEDPWGMTVRRFGDVEGAFRLMTPEESARMAGVRGDTLPPVRIVEEGDLRTVVEASFAWEDSSLLMTYRIPRHSPEIEVEARVFWNEKNRMLKLDVPIALPDTRYLGQTAFGVQSLATNGDEVVAQRWTAVCNDAYAVTCVNDGIYGSDLTDNHLRLSLLRSAAYTGHPIGDRPIVPQNRFTPRIDQGERLFRFWITAGDTASRLEQVDREAAVHNEAPFAVSFFPSGEGERPLPAVVFGDQVVQAPAIYMDGDDLIVRLFEPTGTPRSTLLDIPILDIQTEVALGAFEVRTLRVSRHERTVTAVDPLGDPLQTDG